MIMNFHNLNIIFIMILPVICVFINLVPSHNKNIHPIMMGWVLLIFTTFSSMNLGVYSSSHWFSFIMFLILIGGMMILFLYFTSFISNLKMSMKWIFIKNIPYKMTMMMLFMIYISFNIKLNFPWFNSYDEIYKNPSMFNNLISNNMNLFTYMYSFNKFLSTLMSMLFLLMCLTLIVKMCINKKLSIRKMK